MVIARLKLDGKVAMRAALRAVTGIALATLLSAAAVAGCAALSAGRADCNIVRLQRGAGRSDSDIASALGVTDSDVAACPSGGESGGGETYGGEGSGAPDSGTGAAAGGTGGDQSAGKPPL